MNSPGDNLALYLAPTYFIDAEHPAIRQKADELTAGMSDKTDMAAALFYYVRDTYLYYPYEINFDHHTLKASYILLREGRKHGYCIEKAVLYAALCRAMGIPNRLVFCNVRNHIGTGKFSEVVGTDLMVFHGYNEVYVNGKWIKCTVAFNKSLCDKLGVAALEFDPEQDMIFQEFDKVGGKFMVYEHEYGTFHDVPHDLWKRETYKYYGHLFTQEGQEKFKALRYAN